MLKSRRIASARPSLGAARSYEGGIELGVRARELGRALLDGFKQNDLLTYASAISFQILTAIIPFLLFVLAVAGLLNLSDVWRITWSRRSGPMSPPPCSRWSQTRSTRSSAAGACCGPRSAAGLRCGRYPAPSAP